MPQGNAWLWLSLCFLETWKFRFSSLCCLFRVLIRCDCDETVLFELMIICTGLWLTCFVILFLYALLKFSAAAFEWLAFIAFKKSYVQFCAARKTSASLWLRHCFFGELNSEPVKFFLCGCFLPFQNWFWLWWNCAFWLMITCTGLWLTNCCVTLFVYMTIYFSAVAL